VPKAVAEELGICIVPAYVQIGGRSLRDRVELGREEFYTQLPELEEMPTTAAPPIDDFVRVYRSTGGESDEIVAVLVSEKLSGICNAARVAARQTPQLSVTVVDSGQLSMGLGWQVIAAAESAAQGRSVHEVIDRVERVRSRVRTYATLDTLDFLRRSGRVGWAAAEAARILRIKLILRVAEGVVEVIGRTRTRSRAVAHLIRLTEEVAPIERLAVLHTMAPEVATFTRALSNAVRTRVEHSVLVTTAIGAHVGPRALGVAVVGAA